MLRDRVVCGIYDKAVQRQLLQQPDLTFESALEVTLVAEAAEKDSKRLTGADSIDMHTSNSIGKVRDLPPPQYHKGRKPHESGPQQQSTARADCFRCGGKQEPSHCRFRAYECRHCKKKGHLARVCRKRGQQQAEHPQKAHYIVADAPLSDIYPCTTSAQGTVHRFTLQ